MQDSHTSRSNGLTSTAAVMEILTVMSYYSICARIIAMNLWMIRPVIKISTRLGMVCLEVIGNDDELLSLLPKVCLPNRLYTVYTVHSYFNGLVFVYSYFPHRNEVIRAKVQ